MFQRTDPRDERPSSKWFVGFKPFRIATLLVGCYLLTGVLATILMIHADHPAFNDAAFEAFSALGTVGLTRDLTPNLSSAGKWIDIVLMFTGRVLYPILVMWMIRGWRENPDPVPWT
ncbi:MAG: hypothetical protein ONB42_22550 [candidate division KSB1 bacterium]|nr:hypothetical protein [candidate division KSB1 bacterium]